MAESWEALPNPIGIRVHIYTVTQLDVSKHEDRLSDMEMMLLRDHIGRAYQVAESLSWCNPDRHFRVHDRTISNPTDSSPKNAVVPVIAAEFGTHETARHALTQLREQAQNLDVDVYDVHYAKEAISLAVALEPFELN